MPSQRRKDIFDAKEAMVQLREEKEKKMFIKRRQKLIRSQWRNGIAGVENPLDTNDEDRVIEHVDKNKL